jgi:polar amino acid transport system permease protein
MSYDWNWQLIWNYRDVFLDGTILTIWITILSVIFGTIFGVVLALAKRSNIPVISTLSSWYIYIFRSLPPLILIIWIYYALPIFLGITLSAFTSILISLSINLSAFVAETVRAGIESIPKGQYEAGKVLGMSRYKIMEKIIFPQSIRNILPNLIGLYAMQLKNTSLASIIGINDLLHQGNILISNTFRPLEVYTAVAIIYTIIVLPFLWASEYLERKLKVKSRTL